MEKLSCGSLFALCILMKFVFNLLYIDFLLSLPLGRAIENRDHNSFHRLSSSEVQLRIALCHYESNLHLEVFYAWKGNSHSPKTSTYSCRTLQNTKLRLRTFVLKTLKFRGVCLSPSIDNLFFLRNLRPRRVIANIYHNSILKALRSQPFNPGEAFISLSMHYLYLHLCYRY